MHLDLATALNLIRDADPGIFTGLGARHPCPARSAAVTVLQTALSENSARMLDLFGEIPENAPAQLIDAFDQETKRAIFEFGVRLEVIGYMVFRDLVDLETANDLVGGVVLAYWSRAHFWAEQRRQHTEHSEFLEWCEWLTKRIAAHRATHAYQPAHVRQVPHRN
jgi:hypothetical protein